MRSSRFVSICLANWLVHTYVFLLIPLINRRAAACGADGCLVAWAVLTFAVGMFLPGPFGAHLMEKCSRKSVGLWSVFVMGLLALPANILPDVPALLIVLYGLQGVCFGLAQTALGSTLVNDVLHSSERDRGDILYAWAGRLGIPLGLLAGMLLPAFAPQKHLGLFALLPCALAFLLIAQTRVPFKAPVQVSVVSLDRFLLPRSFRLSLSLFAAPFVFGHVAAQADVAVALLFTIGFAGVYALQIFLHLPMGRRSSVLLGYSFVVLGVLGFCFPLPKIAFWLALLLLGAGVSVVSSRHLLQWITHVGHCQRGTAQSTYMLSWRVAFTLGFVSAFFFDATPCVALVALCLFSMLAFLKNVRPAC